MEPSKDPLGIIAPHAGYSFSGIGSAYSYKFIEKTNKRKFIIIGPNHNGIGPNISVYPPGYWETPLGRVKIDEGLSKIFEKFHDTTASEYEHSIEVQLPFLQYLFDDFTFLPIIIKNPEDINEIVNKIPKDVMVIASSDFTHYGPGYGYFPFEENKRKNVEELDMDAIEKILKLDVKGFLEHMIHYDDTICGYVPIVILMKWLKNFETKGKLLNFYTSGDISGDYENFVAYASIGFENREKQD